MIDTFLKQKGKLERKLKQHIREKALVRTKARLAEKGINIKELTNEELEIIVKDEEDKVVDDYKNKSILALATALGLGFF